jgi:hypothetical protein
VSQQDYSSPQHRLDNLSNMRFVRAYAQVRHHVFHPVDEDCTAAFLRGYIGALDQSLAAQLEIPETLLVGRLVDLGIELCTNNGAKDEAE